nr:hypothetical protein [Tanacetum cinerariifolium]
MQTQTSNTLHNAIMEVGGKDHPLTFSENPKSRDTLTPNQIMNLSTIVSRILHTSSRGQTRKFQFLKVVLSQQLKRIDNDIYSIVDACPNACEMWKAIERLTQDHNKLLPGTKKKQFSTLLNPSMIKNLKIYKPTNNNLRTSSNTSRENQDNSPRINRGAEYDHQGLGNVAEARETVGSTVRDDTDDESEDQKLEAHYMYMTRIQEVSPDAADTRPIFDSEPVQKVSNNDNYNVFTIESEHHEQSASVHDTYPIEQDEYNVIIDSLDMSYDKEQIDQNDDDDDDLANERELLASLIMKLKCEIDDNKNQNKFLETSNKVLVEKLK